MKKILFLLVSIPFLAIADLTIEQLGPNVVVVSGTGNGEYPAVVITNVIGYCTNCVAATPRQMRDFKDEADNVLLDIRAAQEWIHGVSGDILNAVSNRNEDVSKFLKVGAGQSSALTIQITNHAFTVDCTQSTLIREYIVDYPPPGVANYNRIVGYNNGIYDYAHSQDYSYATIESNAREIRSAAYDARWLAQNFRNIIADLPEEACNEIDYLPGYVPGEGDSSTTNVPGIGLEQLDIILDYLRHIDDDQHTRSNQLSYISTNLVILSERTDATYELLRMSLFNDATIVTDDGVNSWSNVYNSGSSQLYDYNRSNILQRIELLLYGVSGINSEVETDTASYEQSMQTIESSLQNSQQELTTSLQGHQQKLSTIGDSLKGFFQSASFLGQGSIAYSILPSVSITIGQDNFDIHTLGMDEAQHSIVQSFCGFVRIAFQVIFHITGIILIFVYYRWFISSCNKLFRWLWDLINGMLGDS